MRRVVIRIVVLLAVAFAGYVAGRTRSQPFAPNLPPPIEVDFSRITDRVRDVDIADATIKSAAAALAGIYAQPIDIDWRSLKSAGLGEDSRVHLQGKQVTLIGAARKLQSAETSSGFDLILSNGSVQLTTVEEAAKRVITRIYTIAPIYEHLCKAPLPADDLTDAAEGGIFGTPSPAVALLIPGTPPTRDAFIEFLTSVVMKNDEDSWKEYGGQIGNVAELNGYLVVTTTAYVHSKVIRALNGLAASMPGEPVLTSWDAP